MKTENSLLMLQLLSALALMLAVPDILNGLQRGKVLLHPNLFCMGIILLCLFKDSPVAAWIGLFFVCVPLMLYII